MSPIAEAGPKADAPRRVPGAGYGSLLTRCEVAEILRVPIFRIYERTYREGSARLPHIKVRKDLRICEEDIRGWLEE